MCHMDPAFLNPPPKDWAPKLGERVRLLYGGKTHDVIVTQVLDSGGFVVSGDDLLMPVACGRNSLRPLPAEEESDAP